MNQSPSTGVDREFTLGESEFQFLIKLAYEKTGIVITAQKRDMLYNRLARRLRALRIADFATYCTLLQSSAGEEEIGHLVNAITTNLTHFFREMHHFEHLRNEVLAPMAQQAHTVHGRPRLRIWSSACSSGMEPYSIAMVMRAAIPNLNEWDARILATDIDSNMLAQGKAGEYPAGNLSAIPTEYKQHITTQESHIHMDQALRDLIAFRQLNLLEPWPMKGPFDAIFCRNVVIYFDKMTKKSLFTRMADMLRPGGWMYIGHSETMQDINTTQFRLIGRTIYQKVM
jgi:chemotaxis protein methyltransferase CheR